MNMGMTVAVAALALLSVGLAGMPVSADGPLPLDCSSPTLKDVCAPLQEIVCFVQDYLLSLDYSPVFIGTDVDGSGIADDTNNGRFGYFQDDGADPNQPGLHRYKFTGFWWSGTCADASQSVEECAFTGVHASATSNEDGSTTVDVSFDSSSCGIHQAGCGIDTECLRQRLSACLNGIQPGSRWGDLEGTPPNIDFDACRP